MKIKTINKLIDQLKLDGIYSNSYQLRLWLTGLNSSAGHLFIDKNSAQLIIDSRYFEEASKTVKNSKVILQKENTLKEISEKLKYEKIGIEKEYLKVGELDFLKKLFPNAKFIPFSSAELRIIKTEEEINNIKKAAQISLKSLEQLKEFIKPGISEKELDAKLEYFQKMNGGKERSFQAIIASGENGSKPHAEVTDKILKEGELVTIDFGTIYKGYCSDITRTFHVGRVTDKKLLEIEQVLIEAQKLGKEAVKPGVTTAEVDKVCRDYISSKGFGQYFVHSTGHGLGIDVHELPNVTSNKQYERVLEPGMIITIEPGIYIPGIGGIRIEDDVLVTKTGHEVLSSI